MHNTRSGRRSRTAVRTESADDANAVPHFLRRQLVVAVEVPRHHRDLEVARERLAELGEKVRCRLDARPVVLVENQEAISAVSRWLPVAHDGER
jgi:hypothetical protein